jgi:hypothetical protein
LSDLEGRHLAELHGLAAELGVPRYRRLPREQLVAALRATHISELHALAARAGVSGYRRLGRNDLLAALVAR